MVFHIQSSQFGNRQIYQTTKSNYSKHKGWMNPLSWHVTYLDHDFNDWMNERSLNDWMNERSSNQWIGWVVCLQQAHSLSMHQFILIFIFQFIIYIFDTLNYIDDITLMNTMNDYHEKW